MVNIIGAMVFIILSLFMITSSDLQIRNIQSTQNRVSYIQQEAKELTQYSNAVFNYITAYGLPVSQSNLSVSNLISTGLLPNNFPSTTPFGQSFTVNYNVDSANPNVEDVIIRTTGNLNFDLAARANLTGTLGYAYLANEVDSKVNIPPYPNSTGTYVGTVNSNVFSGDGQNINLSFTANNTEPSIYIKAPDQYGYWLINISFLLNSYGYNGLDNTSIDYLDTVENGGGLNIISQGWFANCPSYADNVTSNVIYNGRLYQNPWYDFPDDVGQAMYCFPAYKDEVESISITVPLQYLDLNSYAVINEALNGSSSNNYDNGFGGTPIKYLYSGASYVSDSKIKGYADYPTYGIEGLITINGIGSLLMSNSADFMPPAPAYSFLGDSGFQLNLTNPSGQTVVYQIAAAEYSIITGPGCYDSTLTSEYDAKYDSTFQVYINANASGNAFAGAGVNNCGDSGQNLDSIGSYAAGWVININPSNPDSYTFGNDSDVGTSASTFPYYEDWYNGNYYSIPLTADTSNVYN
jgi:hypothetical protein